MTSIVRSAKRPSQGELEAEGTALLDRAAHDPPQDVAAVFVGGDDAVGDQEGGAAGVVGDDPHRPRVLAPPSS